LRLKRRLIEMSNTTSSIEQLNLGYNQQEDRLLLKVGMADQSEVLIWITRRICKELWHLLQNSHGQVVDNLKQTSSNVAQNDLPAILKPITAPLSAPRLAKSEPTETPLPMPRLVSKEQSFEAFARERTLQKSLEVMNFNSEYMQNRKSISEAPMLVAECNIVANERNITSLTFKAVAGESIKIGLTLELVVALTNMMQMATREAGWDLLMLHHSQAKHLFPNQQVLH
jgi:hypothetical protein